MEVGADNFVWMPIFKLVYVIHLKEEAELALSKIKSILSPIIKLSRD